MSEWLMQGHFRYLRFKTFPTTPRTLQCKVFWAFLSSSEHSGVPEDSKPPTFPSVGLHPHTWPKWGCDTLAPRLPLVTTLQPLCFGREPKARVATPGPSCFLQPNLGLLEPWTLCQGCSGPPRSPFGWAWWSPWGPSKSYKRKSLREPYICCPKG